MKSASLYNTKNLQAPFARGIFVASVRLVSGREPNVKELRWRQSLDNRRARLVVATGLTMIARFVAIFALGWAMSCTSLAGPEESPLLEKVGTIALPDTGGRIDHLAIDRARGRLFVAEIANDSVDVIDLEKSKVIHR